jgi:Cu+-exporting ATPase
VVDGRQVVVGHERLLRDLGIAISPLLASQWTHWERAGQTAVLVGWDGQLRGALAVGDAIKPSAAAAVDDCAASGCGRSCSPGTTRRPRRRSPRLWASRR